jgi:hypothetical protein
MTRDDELNVSQSSSRYDRADRGHGEKLEKNTKSAKMDRMKLKRDMLAKNVKKESTFGTKSSREEAKEQTASVDMKPKPDVMIEQSKRKQAAEDASAYERQQNPA